MSKKYKIFENGSTWVRADFHLHTKSDKEFAFNETENSFVGTYITKLIEQNIRVGVITNHNKFDYNEYKALSKKARRNEIYLLPGIELSVNDGRNGIHTLIVFNNKEWLSDGNDYINQFLNSTFAGKHNFENENGRSNDSLIETIKKLDNFNKDYFILLAHIEQRSGFYKELDGGRISELAKKPSFRKRVLGFQKVRTRDYAKNLKNWFDKKLPAFIEGSDPKKIDDIGKGKQTYIKIGDYNFTAVKYALLDYEYRLSEELPKPSNGYLKSISFQGGKLDGTTIRLNNSMNNLIGIRGSGKSSILETIRYALDIEISNNLDKDGYKTGLVNNTLKSGGKVNCVFVDNQGREYSSEKILGDRTNIYLNNELQYGLKPTAIIRKPLYFGQKDLSQIGGNLSNQFFIEKIIGENLSEIKAKINEKNQSIIEIISEIKKTDNKLKRKEEYEEKKADLINKIKIFKDNKIDKKLERQVQFEKDINYIKHLKKFELKIIDRLTELFNEYNKRFEEYKLHQSTENNKEIEKIIKTLIDFEISFNEIEPIIKKLKEKLNEIDNCKKNIINKYDELKEEFSIIKRKINVPNIQADDYVKYTNKLDLTETQLKELNKLVVVKKDLQRKLKKSLVELQNLWHKEFEIIQNEIKNINANQNSITIEVSFKGDKNNFENYLKNKLTGSNIRGSKVREIVNTYSDLINIFFDLYKEKSELKNILTDNQFYTFKTYFENNQTTLLTYRIPDKFDIIYKGRPLQEHSLGQRASALIIFLLTLKDSDLIIIDQPEDDLDNQTIYNDVIKILKKLKNQTQFIFATHNPNIPVLGDCEQIISCNYSINKIETSLGSIDNELIRDNIVNVMEGGEEAFNNRKRIYELWTH